MEKEKMKTLIIKEVKEFFCNYKSWLNIIVISGVFYLFGDKELPINHFYEWFALMAPLQYVYDSFIMDTNTKGMVFLYNTKNRYLSIFVIKNFISLILLIITFLISFPYFQKNIQLQDFLWIIPTLFFGVSLMQIAAIFSKGAEITSAFITMGVVLSILQIILLLNNILLISLISICLAVLTFFAAWKFSESNYYRTQI